MTTVTIEDWAADFAAVLAETYCLSVAEAQALADELAEPLRAARLVARPSGTPPYRVLEQAKANASFERMAAAEQVGQGMALGRLRGTSDYRLGATAWAGFFCGSLALSFDLTPGQLVGLIDRLAGVLERFGVPERPVQLLTRPLLANLPIASGPVRPEQPSP